MLQMRAGSLTLPLLARSLSRERVEFLFAKYDAEVERGRANSFVSMKTSSPGVNTQLRDRSPTADLFKACSGGLFSRLNYKCTHLKREAEVCRAPPENSDVPPLARFLLEGRGVGVTSTLVGGETRPSAQQLAVSHLLFRAEPPFRVQVRMSNQT